MGEVLGDLESPADLEPLDEDQLEDWLEAHQTLRGVCISQRVPGWAPAYLDRPALALSPEVDLAEYGVVQPLGLAEREPELVFGPGLGVVRRAELIDREIVIAWWTKREGGQILNASGATFATGTSMGQSGGSVGGANQPMVIDNANNVGLGENFLLSWPVRSDAAFVTVVVGNERWVQQPISQIAAFVLPGRSAVLTQYDANGDVLRG